MADDGIPEGTVGAGPGSGAPNPANGTEGIPHKEAESGDEGPQGTLEDLLAMIIQVTTLASEHGVALGGQHLNKYEATNTVIKSWHHGNPYRFDKGLEKRTVTRKNSVDNYYTWVLKVLELLGWEDVSQATLGEDDTEGVATTVQEVTNVYKYTEGDLVALPVRQVHRQYAPMFKILNFTASLTNPAETQSRYMMVELTNSGVGGNWAFICNVMTWWMFQAISKQHVMDFYLIGLKEFGVDLMNETLEAAGKPKVVKTVWEAVDDAKQRTKLAMYMIEYIGLQIANKMSVTDLAKANIVGNIMSQESIDSVTNLAAYNASYDLVVKTIVEDRDSKFYLLKLVGATEKEYEFGSLGQGAASMVVITTRSSRLSSNYTMCQNSVSTEIAIAESHIRQLKPLTRVVKYPYESTGGGTSSGVNVSDTNYNKIQIPTTNWKDVENAYNMAPAKVTQHSKTQSFKAETVNDAVAEFKRMSSTVGVRTAKMQYSPIKGMATMDMSAISTRDGGTVVTN